MRTGKLYPLVIAAQLIAGATISPTAGAAPRPTIGDCILRYTHTVRYVGCDAAPGGWPQHSAPFNPAVALSHAKLAETFSARYGHEITLGRATALGKPASAAECGTPVGERYSDATVYAKLASVCPELPASYVISGDDRDDLKRAEHPAGRTFFDTHFASGDGGSALPAASGSTVPRGLPPECLSGACLPQCGCTPPPPPPADRPTPPSAGPIVQIPQWILDQCAREKPPAAEVAATKAWRAKCEGITHARGYVPATSSTGRSRPVLSHDPP